MNESSWTQWGVPDSAAHVLHAVAQFLTAVRRRWHMMLASFLAVALLGGLYYATAPRIYSSKAEILILQTGDNPLSPTIEAQGNRENSLIPTFVNLMASARVLEGAIQHLSREDLATDLGSENPANWVSGLRRNLSTSAVLRTNILTVEYRSKDPGVAARVVGAVVQSYLDFMRSTTQGTAAEIVRILTTEKDEIARQLSEKEQALQQLSQQIGALDVGVNTQTVHPLVERAKSFNAALVEVQKKRVQLTASLQALENAVSRGEDIRQYLFASEDPVGRELLLGVLGFSREETAARLQLERTIIEDRIELTRLLQDLGNNHPRVQALQQRIATNEAFLEGYQDRLRARLANLDTPALTEMLLGTLRQKAQELWQQELSLQAQYEQARAEAANLAGGLAQLEMLKNDIAGLRELYGGLVRRITNLDLAGDLRAAVITEPRENPIPVSPSLPRVLVMVILGGLALGMFVVYVMDVLDDRFRTVEEMQWQLRTPVLSIIREMPSREAQGVAALEVAVDPGSTASEAFRTLRTALALSEQPATAIVITSTQPGDGKSTVAANLAVACAQVGKKTLLVDGDLRRPGLTTLLGMRGEPGLAEVLRDLSPIPDSVAQRLKTGVVPDLDVLPCGRRPTNPAELLAGPRLSELLNWAGEHYDQIIIDSPPAPLASDTAIWGRLADGVVLVIQPEKNKRRAVLRAAEYLRLLKITLLGIVVNRVQSGKEQDYTGYSGDYYGEPEESAEDPSAEPPEATPQLIPRQRIVPRRVA